MLDEQNEQISESALIRPGGPLFRTSDADEAQELITGAYAAHQLRPRGPAGDLDFRMWLSEFERLNIGYTAFGVDIEISAPPIQSYYIVTLPLIGGTQAMCGRDSAELTTSYGAIMRPTEPMGFEGWTGDCVLLGVRINRGDLEDELAAMLGRPLDGPVRFDFGMNFDSPEARSFLRALRVLQEEAERPDGMARHPAMAGRLSQLVISGLLHAQRHNYSEDLEAPSRPAAPAAIRRAIEFIEANPADVASASDVARTACLSIRAVEEGFKKHVGMAPMAYLREVRLARVRAELLAADPSSTTVGAVANRWGFAHLGRFTEAYRRKFGVLPSQTLRERRSLAS